MQVRSQAVSTALSLTGTAEGRDLLLKSEIPSTLCRLVGDLSGSAENAVKSLVNLSADGELMQSMLKDGMISKLMESLRDSDCAWKRYVVMLLANLSQTDEGCIQLMQLNDTAATLKGLHLRRLIQYFVGPVAVPPGCRYTPTAESDAVWDPYEYCGDILANATRLEDARRILLEPERRILPVLFPQLLSPSMVRRRGAAATLRNCCFEKSEAAVRYVLSPSVDILTALCQPLVGPDQGQYAAEDKDFMNSALFKNSANKRRESDPFVRRQVLESLLLLASSRMARDAMRRVRVYPIVKSFHEWLEGEENYPTSTTAAAAAPPVDVHAIDGLEEEGGSGSGRAKGGSAGGGGGMVGAREDDDTSEALHPDDEAAVEAINRLVQQLFREDEYVWPSASKGGGQVGSTGASQRDARPNAAPVEEAGAGLAPTGAYGRHSNSSDPGPQKKPVDETRLESMAGQADKAKLQQEAERRTARFATVPAAQAKAAAAAVARGVGHTEGIAEAELSSVVTQVPDWTEDDPELPEAWKPKE